MEIDGSTDDHRSEGHTPRTDDGVDRRGLFTWATATGLAGLAGAALAGCAKKSGSLEGPSFSPPAFELEEVDLTTLAARLTAGEETALGLVDKYEARIEQLNTRGPELRAVIETNPEARAIAADLDRERAAGKVRGPLHGIPVLLKDNIDTADRLMTTAGSLALEGSIAPKDAFVARRLREAGAIILGKANMSEWANLRSLHGLSGWSARGGLCKNPYALDRTPSGSSSGSGAAVAASMCAAALGTETDGSIVSPASMMGLVGLKPTVGLLSRAGIIPISHTQDTPGPMTRTVTDAAILLSALAAADPADAATTTRERPAREDYTKRLDPGALKGTRIGVVRSPLFGQHPAADQLAEEAIAQIERLGATIVDPIYLQTPADLGANEMEVLLFELKADLEDYLQGLGPDTRVRTLADLIAFNKAHAAEELALFGQDAFEQAEAKGPLTDADYLDRRLRNLRATREEGIDRVMQMQRLDALIGPTGWPANLVDPILGDYYSGGASTIPAIAGYPHITVPMGDWHGLPVGLSFFGLAWSEGMLLAYAFAYEQATKHRRPPKYLASVR